MTNSVEITLPQQQIGVVRYWWNAEDKIVYGQEGNNGRVFVAYVLHKGAWFEMKAELVSAADVLTELMKLEQ